MFDKTKITNLFNTDALANASQALGMLMMSTALLATVAADSGERRAIVPQKANVAPIEEQGGHDSLRREKESEIHEQHIQSKVNERTPYRSGRV